MDREEWLQTIGLQRVRHDRGTNTLSFHGNTMLSLLKNCQIVFQSICTILHSQQQCMRITTSPHPYSYLALSVLFITVILVGVKWYLTVVLICISVMANDVEHLSMCLLTIPISSLEKCVLKYFVHFFKLGYCLLIRILVILYIFWIQILYQVYNSQKFSFCGRSFHFLSFEARQFLILMMSKLFFIACAFGVISNPRSHRFVAFSSKSFVGLALTIGL